MIWLRVAPVCITEFGVIGLVHGGMTGFAFSSQTDDGQKQPYDSVIKSVMF